MRKVTLMLTALALVLGISQCKKQEKPVQAGEKQRIELTADNGNDGSKVGGSFSAATMNLYWEKGDVITVSGGATGTLTLERGAGTSQGFFSGEIEIGSGDLVFTWTKPSRGGNGEDLDFNAQDGTQEWIIGNLVLEGKAPYSDNGKYSLKMEMPYAVLKLNLSPLVGQSGNDVEVSAGNGAIATVKSLAKAASSEVYVAVPELGEHTYTFSGNDESVDKAWTLEANTYYTAGTDGAAIVILPEGALKGLFTVGVDGKGNPRKVRFSKGNLQYQASTDTWRFAEHQFDFVGDATSGNVYEGGVKCDNANAAQSYDGWIDVFGWGTSGYHQSSDSYNVNYQPYSTSRTSAPSGTDAYNYNRFGYGPSTNVTPAGPAGMTQSQGNISGSYYDWGVYNAISNGGGEAGKGKWRTLTGAGTGGEWFYLINTRTMTNGKPRYTNKTEGITIGGTTYQGVFIYPDDYNGTEVGTDETTNTWDKIDALGIVFLPATGHRNGASVYNVGSNGYYWSSSYGDTNFANYLYFFSGSVSPHAASYRYFGMSVRLVSEN